MPAAPPRPAIHRGPRSACRSGYRAPNTCRARPAPGGRVVAEAHRHVQPVERAVPASAPAVEEVGRRREVIRGRSREEHGRGAERPVVLAQVDDRARPVRDERQLVEDEQPLAGSVRPEAQDELDGLAQLVRGGDGLEREEAGAAAVARGDAIGDETLGERRLAALAEAAQGEHGARGEVVAVERARIPAERGLVSGRKVRVVQRPRSQDDDIDCSANSRPDQPTSSTPARSQARLSRTSTVARASSRRAASAR